MNTTALRGALDEAAAHWHRGDLDAALAACRHALSIDARCVDALANVATIVWFQGDPDQAERLYRRALEAAPAHVGLMINLATLRNEAGRPEEALRWLERARVSKPADREIVWRQSLAELALGDYANGWMHYEAGLGDASLRGAGPGFATPPWDGSPCDRLVLWHEQGFGDTIQFVRYAERCRASARRVIVLCPTELIRLLDGCPFVDEAVDSIAAGDFDAHRSLMSLPALFGTRVDTIPASVPYLFADAARAGAAPCSRHDTVRVGLVWAGNVRGDQVRFRSIDRRRNIGLDALAPLLDVPGVRFFGLQKGDAAREGAAYGIVDALGAVVDFADTAARIAPLDLVISVDTSVAHLAGAMGKPVWVLSRLDACWRWLRNRPDSPWYPTARVFGQTRRDDWSDVVDAVRRALVSWVASRRRPEAS